MIHQPRVWSLHEAKAKFSEVVRRAQTEGPQTVTVHGQPAVVITVAQPKQKLIAGKYEPTGTGLDLIRVMQACPYPEVFDAIDAMRIREPLIGKDVDLE